ncbi:MAG: ABC transporter permease [Bryobacteraceae bacterium]
MRAFRLLARHLAELRQDVRYGVRMLAKSPGFTAVAVISVSLGICIATCAYSELHGLVLRDLPRVSKPDELVALQMPTSYQAYKRYRGQTDIFSSTFAYVAPVPFAIALGERTERTWGHLVTPSYFLTLGVRPAFGRFFDKEEDEHDATPAVVVSYRFWQIHLGSDPRAIGKTLRINGHRCTVIGVATDKFLGASPVIFVADLWMPMLAGERIAPELAGNALERRDSTIFRVVGRLRPGIAEGQAEAQLDSVAREMERDYGDVNRNRNERRVLLVSGGKEMPLRKQDVPIFTEFFTVLGGLLLLIACANVANMMLARAADRRREIAVRLSVGASRARLIRQLLTESVLISSGAGLLAFLLSMWIMRGASRIRMPYPIPVSFDLTPDWRAFLFTLALMVCAGLAFGLVPAWQATGTDLAFALKEGGLVQFRRFRRLSLRNVLMLGQMAASMTLLLMTGYLALGSQSTLGIDPGFNPRNLYLMSLDPIRDGYSSDRAAAFFDKLLDRVKPLSGITAACLTDSVPAAVNGNGSVTFSTAGKDASDPRSIHSAQKFVVGKDYFATTGISILTGRSFRKEDEEGGTMPVILSQAFVREFSNGENILGQHIELGNGEIDPGKGVWPGAFDYRVEAPSNRRQIVEVVGVAKDVAEGFGVQKPPPTIYFPLRPADYSRPSLGGITLMVRTMPGVDAIGEVRREVAAIDSRLTVFNARSMVEQIGDTLFAVRAGVWTYGIIGIVGLILASVGLAGVTAYSVARRGREIGIRMAMGAQKAQVMRLIMKEGVVLTLAGSVIGLAMAWVGTRALGAVFSSVAQSSTLNSYGTLFLAAAPVLLAMLALTACYLPARKSTRIDPAVVLRQE